MAGDIVAGLEEVLQPGRFIAYNEWVPGTELRSCGRNCVTPYLAPMRMINQKAALKWVLQDENVHTSIPAISNYDELREDLSVMEDLAFTPEERRDLELGDRLNLAGCFCQQCARCVPQCPAGMDIPRWMRASMYAVGHGRLAKARETLGGSGAPSCADCSRCEVECSLGLDIRSRSLELAGLLDIGA